jgi:hypothetical protein
MLTTVPPVCQKPSAAPQPPMWNIGNTLSATSSSLNPEQATCERSQPLQPVAAVAKAALALRRTRYSRTLAWCLD